MLRILHIARYRNKMLERKVEFMSQDAGFLFFLVRPKQYEDAYGSLTLQSTTTKTDNILHLSLIGKHIDPHRVLYGSLSFSMKSFKPDIIHAEDEPANVDCLLLIMNLEKLSSISLQTLTYRKNSAKEPFMSRIRFSIGPILRINSRSFTKSFYIAQSFINVYFSGQLCLILW